MQTNEEVNVNFKEGFKKLSALENKYDLFDRWYQGIPLWFYSRDRALNIISGITSYQGQTTAKENIHPLNLAKRIFHFLCNFYKLAGNDAIIFTNERHLDKDFSTGGYYNPFAELPMHSHKNLKKFLIFEFPVPMTAKYQTVNYQRYLPLDLFICIVELFSPLSFFHYYTVKKEFDHALRSSDLFKESEIKELVWRCRRSAYSITCYGIFLKLVKFLNPKVSLIYSCMGGFDKFPGVIEIQPALITNNQSVYIYPKTPPVKKYLEDKKMVVFSQQTKDLLANNGYVAENIIIESNPKIKFYFLKNISKKASLGGLKNPKNSMVIIGNWGWSVGQILENLVATIELKKELFKDWEICMVLHPTQKNTYKNLHLEKVKIFENHEVSLWEMLSKAICTVNVSSTVIQEATYFGCFNIILKDVKFKDQMDFIESLCGEYPYKSIIEPEEFVNWFLANENNIKGHLAQKNKIIKENYEYFINSLKISKDINYHGNRTRS